MRIKINGEFFYTESESFLYELERLGIEGVSEYIQELEDKADYNQLKVNSDMTAYESQLDELNCLNNDILDELNIICEYIDESKRISKEQIYSRLQKMIKDINNVI